MSKVLTCMETAFKHILEDPKLFINEVFMMKPMFHNITDTLGPLCEYLEHIFEQKVTFNIDSVNNNDLMLDLLHSVLFYPT